MDALRNSKKNCPPSCSHSLFINIFQFDWNKEKNRKFNPSQSVYCKQLKAALLASLAD
jgi:hypothetical protein